MSELSEVLERLLGSPALTEAELEADERQHAFVVPDSVREVVRVAGGAELWKPGAKILKVFYVALIVDVLEQLAGSPLYSGLVPFADDSGPSWFAVDGAGIVYQFDRGGGEPERIAPDVLTFLSYYEEHGQFPRPFGQGNPGDGPV